MPTLGLGRSVRIGILRVEGSGEGLDLQCLAPSLVKKPQSVAFVGDSQFLCALNETQKFLQPLQELSTLLNILAILNTTDCFQI